MWMDLQKESSTYMQLFTLKGCNSTYDEATALKFYWKFFLSLNLCESKFWLIYLTTYKIMNLSEHNYKILDCSSIVVVHNYVYCSLVFRYFIKCAVKYCKYDLCTFLSEHTSTTRLYQASFSSRPNKILSLTVPENIHDSWLAYDTVPLIWTLPSNGSSSPSKQCRSEDCW